MHHYAMSLPSLLDLPIYTFWELSRNAERQRASEDMRMLGLLSQVIGGDTNSYAKELEEKRGVIVRIDQGNSEFDKSGYQRLRLMMGGLK